jgi:hypothetical protein
LALVCCCTLTLSRKFSIYQLTIHQEHASYHSISSSDFWTLIRRREGFIMHAFQFIICSNFYMVTLRWNWVFIMNSKTHKKRGRQCIRLFYFYVSFPFFLWSSCSIMCEHGLYLDSEETLVNFHPFYTNSQKKSQWKIEYLLRSLALLVVCKEAL